MLSQRMAQQSLRRVAASNPNVILIPSSYKLATSISVGIKSDSTQIRPASTQKMTENSAYDILVQQRLKRPVAPHLGIYKPQITWYASALNRITGAIFSGGLYVFGSAYLVAPLFGWHLESASIAAAVASWPVLAKVATKFAIAMPFTFHAWNSLRHFAWDLGKEFSNLQVIRTGWIVVGLTVASSALLAYM